MKRLIILTLTVGTISAVSGFFLGKKVEKKKLEDEFNHQLEELQNYYHKMDHVPEEVIDVKGPVQVEGEDDNKPVINTVKDILKDYTPSDSLKPKKTYRKKKEDEESGTIKSTIHRISLEEYGNSKNASETLVYYSNGILTNGDGDVINNPQDYIGEEGLAECKDVVMLMEMGRSGEDLYFRNDILVVDFEVQITDEVYGE